VTFFADIQNKELMHSTLRRERKGFYNSDELVRQAGTPDVAPFEILASCSIIAAVNSSEKFTEALDSPTRAIYLLMGTPLTLPDMLARARDRSKVCLVNIDFLEGLSRDRHAVEFLAAHHVDGVVSTRFETLKAAHTLGLITVQRTFAIDSAAVTAVLRCLAQFLPDAIEVLPAMAAPKVALRLGNTYPSLKIIGGGLIENVKEIEDLLATGIHSVSVSDERLWLI
jgi:glycerol uptake operon antiterminator